MSIPGKPFQVIAKLVQRVSHRPEGRLEKRRRKNEFESNCILCNLDILLVFCI